MLSAQYEKVIASCSIRERVAFRILVCATFVMDYPSLDRIEICHNCIMQCYLPFMFVFVVTSHATDPSTTSMAVSARGNASAGNGPVTKNLLPKAYHNRSVTSLSRLFVAPWNTTCHQSCLCKFYTWILGLLRPS